MKREELYEKVMEISNRYGLPVKINKKTKKEELKKMYDNMSKLSQEEELIDLTDLNKTIEDEDIQDILKDYPFDDEEDDNNVNLDLDDEQDEDYDDEQNEDDDQNEIVDFSTKQKPKRKVKSNRMQNILKKQSINSLKKQVTTILNKYDKECIQIYNDIKDLGELDDEEIEITIDNYNEVRTDAENEINLTIDAFDGDIPDSFYTWVEGRLDSSKKRIEKFLK